MLRLQFSGKLSDAHGSVAEEQAYEGCAAEFIVDIIIGSLFPLSWITILVMAGTATIVETVTDKLDVTC